MQEAMWRADPARKLKGTTGMDARADTAAILSVMRRTQTRIAQTRSIDQAS